MDRFGIMEWWNDGILLKTEIFLLTQYSNIPMFHYPFPGYQALPFFSQIFSNFKSSTMTLKQL